jgi:16S rRNA processing protein RimM
VTTKADATYITVGKVGSTYGVRGWLKVQSYMEPRASILDQRPWYMQYEKDTWKVIEVEQGKPHGSDIIVKFAGINTPEEARLLTGKMIAITRSQLPPLNKNEYYWSDLIGLTVINKHGEIYGKVIDMMATGSNDVLIVKGNKEHAIPYLLGSVILNIDLEKQEILVDWELI